MRDNDNFSPRVSRRRRRLKISLLAILAVLLVIGVVVFRNVGRWLVREDPVGKADVIVVLSGGLPFRAEGAASVFKSGYAPAVWVSRPQGPQEELAALGIDFVGEEEYNREFWFSRACRIPRYEFFRRHRKYAGGSGGDIAGHAAGRNAHGDYRYFAATHAPGEGLWTKLVGDDPRVIVRAAPGDPFDADHWWRNTQDVLAVVRETMGLLNVWAGLPVRPHLQ